MFLTCWGQCGASKTLTRKVNPKKTVVLSFGSTAAVFYEMRLTASESAAVNSDLTMDDVKNLIKKKDEIEEQIKAYYDVLEDVSVAVVSFAHMLS